jgi:teichuronic acid biosynthesis glycosyltransferase TuaC
MNFKSGITGVATNNIRSLAVITHGYPCVVNPTWLVFVRQIAHAFARQGVDVSVICPLALHRAIIGKDPAVSTENAGAGAHVTVYRPRYLSFASRRVGFWNTFNLTCLTHRLATQSVLKKKTNKVDALYGHFLYPSGACAVQLGRKFGIPSFPSAGEISLDTMESFGHVRAEKDLIGATGIIANSNHLAKLLDRDLGFSFEKVRVFPNAVNRRMFYPSNRHQMRARWGLPENKFLVVCVGGFELRKGQDRVSKAIDGLVGVGGVFVGAGAQEPSGNNVVFCRALPHALVPELLSACDVFVLPSIDEGCCNAVIEAMACGLPVISSTGAFNDDILNPEVSIRTDPLDVLAIREAIIRLRDDESLRIRMGSAALKWSENFDADVRARRILSFMEERVTLGKG